MLRTRIALRNHLYYAIKPWIPWRARNAVRGWFARRLQTRVADRWPVKSSAGTTPAGWPGWPDGRKFAVVLTHDVETADGLAKCERLMALERELGFRSSFNLIPEGNYRVTSDLRSRIRADGFEIGVHDLYHDGRLFLSRKLFRQAANRINYYLVSWEAYGFRAGFMFNESQWIHDLDIEYDASAFDTDPFEPQPEDSNTIFPFWVPRPASGQTISSGFPARRGYVKLPYTLPQDSTLFLLLRQTTPEIWIRKLDWIAAHGGMALLNVHPDYLRFPGDRASSATFPVEHYIKLLRHVRQNYADRYWHALPRDVATHFRSNCIHPK